MREHAFLGLQTVDKVQQDAEEAIRDCQQQNDTPQTRTLTGQLRQGQREYRAEHDNHHYLRCATTAISLLRLCSRSRSILVQCTLSLCNPHCADVLRFLSTVHAMPGSFMLAALALITSMLLMRSCA